ncbi:MAG TPA: nucleotidyltransferase family protein [Fibrobacteria bacterium]|nr:nucleotidyltransferase family protein [Fibrobacteria bacterium]
MEAIVLAGGMGTRLKSVVSEIPKPMAPVDGRPFLEFLLAWLAKSGTSRAVLSVGYKWEVVRERFGSAYAGMSLDYAVEDTPLGTGGAVALALGRTTEDSILVVNGDTAFPVDLAGLLRTHRESGAGATLALKEMTEFDRYGTVELDARGRVAAFREKARCARGAINGGIYAMDRAFLDGRGLPGRFSLEQDVLEKEAGAGALAGVVFDAPFLDIGIPEDYAKAADFLAAAGMSIP